MTTPLIIGNQLPVQAFEYSQMSLIQTQTTVVLFSDY